MPKRLGLTLLFILLHTASACYGMEVVAVKSSPAQPYEVALEAFSRHLITLCPAQGTKAIHPDISIRPITLTSATRPEDIRRAIRAKNPDLIVALGSNALRVTAPINDIPIIYLLVPAPADIAASPANITGVLLQPEVSAQFRALNDIMPTLKRVGVLYDPTKTASLVDSAAATNHGLVFIRRPISSPHEVAGQLASLAGKIDLLWMVPDSTILSTQTEKSFYRFSQAAQIPILAFSEKYLSRGATFAVHLDLEAMGQMAAMFALQIKEGKKPQDLPPRRTDRVTLTINHTLVDKLGLQLQEPQP